MALPPFESPRATTFEPAAASFFFDIDRDGQPPPAPAPESTPTQSTCGTAVLPAGPCNFTDQSLPRCGCRRFWSRSPMEEVDICQCSHHACFHEYVWQALRPVAVDQEKQRPNRAPLIPVPDMSFHMSNLPLGLPLGLPLPSLVHNGQKVTSNDNLEIMPDTLHNLRDLAQAGYSLPPIPSQCLITSRTASTTASSQNRYLQPFGGKGLNTLSEAVPQAPADRDRASPRTENAPEPLPSAACDNSCTIQDHEERIERLENMSLSILGHDDCLEKHEATHARATELENRIEELERLHRRAKGDDDEAASVTSASTAASRQEIHSQIQELQAQVKQLYAAVPSAALPSCHHPRELEVVLLPFPLRGIWMRADQITCAQPATADAQSSLEWVQDPNWLLPKAFANGCVIDRRLRSRGLVKTVSVRGPDARSVDSAMRCFDHVLAGEIVLDKSMTHFLGLKQSWVPLRKIYKDSRLRFLTRAEMATPTLWDYTFLESSVVMKATGMHRLYMTHPEAYLQRAGASGWSWQKVRELPVDADQSISDSVDASDCWAWNDGLDGLDVHNEVLSGNTSYASADTHTARYRRSITTPSHFYGRQSLPTPRLIRAESPAIRRNHSLGVTVGSSSPQAPSLTTPANRRRMTHIVGRPYDRHSSTFRPRNTVSLVPSAVVHDSTRSPSLRRRTTPAYSRTTMSRSPSLAPPGISGYDDRGERRNTPSAYATPHSVAPAEYCAGSRGPIVPPSDDYQEDVDMEDNRDSYDSETTNEADADAADSDMEDEDDELDGVETDGDDGHAQPRPDRDMPWAGIEDADNIAIHEDILSNASSQPSEYPSREQAWQEPSAGPLREISVDGVLEVE